MTGHPHSNRRKDREDRHVGQEVDHVSVEDRRERPRDLRVIQERLVHRHPDSRRAEREADRKFHDLEQEDRDDEQLCDAPLTEGVLQHGSLVEPHS